MTDPLWIDCTACGGTGTVEAASGGMRPCSVCRWGAFTRWCQDRRPPAGLARARDFEGRTDIADPSQPPEA